MKPPTVAKIPVAVSFVCSNMLPTNSVDILESRTLDRGINSDLGEVSKVESICSLAHCQNSGATREKVATVVRLVRVRGVASVEVQTL